jgi:hypothetical protein
MARDLYCHYSTSCPQSPSSPSTSRKSLQGKRTPNIMEEQLVDSRSSDNCRLEIHVVGYMARATLKPEANHPNCSCLSRNLPSLDGVMQSRDGAGRHGMSLYQPLTTQGRKQKTRYGNDWMRISADGVLGFRA